MTPKRSALLAVGLVAICALVIAAPPLRTLLAFVVVAVAHSASHDITLELTVVDERGATIDSVLARVNESTLTLGGTEDAKSKDHAFEFSGSTTIKSSGFQNLYVMLSKKGYRSHAVSSSTSGVYRARVVLRDLLPDDPDQVRNDVTSLPPPSSRPGR